MTLIPQPRYVVRVSVNDGRIEPKSPLTVKNQIRPIPTNSIESIEDIMDVSIVQVANGSTIVYNSSNDKYEIVKLNDSIDFGEY